MSQSVHMEPVEPDVFLLDTLCYYLRCGTQPVNLPLYSVKVRCTTGTLQVLSSPQMLFPSFSSLLSPNPSSINLVS